MNGPVVFTSREDAVAFIREVLAMHASQAPADRPLPEPLVSKKTLAEHVDVATVTIDRLVNEGLPFVTVGTHRRFRISEVEAWLVANRRGQVAAKAEATTTTAELGPVRLVSGVRRGGGPR